MNNDDLNDMIAVAATKSGEDFKDASIAIMRALNERIETLKGELATEKRWRAGIMRGQGGEP